VLTLVVELAIFLNVKTQAYLFLQFKISEDQQGQMKGLLDLVPDSVLICTKGTEES